jgi:radical SAM protein with 4Fe4S-binding SPASM domain
VTRLFRAIQVQTIDLCNRSCSFCPNRSDMRKTGALMDLEVFEKVLADLKALHYRGRFSPYLMNEPLLDSRIYDWTARARAALPRCLILLSTNGDPLLASESAAEKLVNCGVDAVHINCYDADESAFAALQGLVGDMAARFPQVLVHETASMARLNGPNGRVNVSLRWMPAAGTVFWNRGGHVPDVAPSATRSREHQCSFPWKQMYVNHLGEAVICCSDWAFEVVLGNVMETSLGEIWKNDDYRRVRRLHSRNKLDEIPLCARCNHAHQPVGG